MADTEGTITEDFAISIVLGQTIYDRNGEKSARSTTSTDTPAGRSRSMFISDRTVEYHLANVLSLARRQVQHATGPRAAGRRLHWQVEDASSISR